MKDNKVNSELVVEPTEGLSDELRENLQALRTLEYPHGLHGNIMSAVFKDNSQNLGWNIFSSLNFYRLGFALVCLLFVAFLFESEPVSVSQKDSKPALLATLNKDVEPIMTKMSDSNQIEGLDEISEEEIQDFLIALEKFNTLKNNDKSDNSINLLPELHLVTDK